MAMNKKERAAFDDAILREKINRALRWSAEVRIEPDIAVPSGRDGQKCTVGWRSHHAEFQGPRAFRAWSEPNAHGHGPYLNIKPNTYRSGASQNGIALYSTEELALRALRCEMEMRFAKQLAELDAQIDKLRGTKAAE